MSSVDCVFHLYSFSILKKILVIENDLDILDLLKLFLDDIGFEVMPSQNRIPIEKIITDNPSLVLLDYFLNDGYGNEICLEIKENPLTKRIPVIIMSASDHIKKYALQSSADAFISKPFDILDLEILVRETLI